MSLVAVQTVADKDAAISRVVIEHVFGAAFSFTVSLACGLFALYFLAFEPEQNPLNLRRIGIPLGGS